MFRTIFSFDSYFIELIRQYCLLVIVKKKKKKLRTDGHCNISLEELEHFSLKKQMLLFLSQVQAPLCSQLSLKLRDERTDFSLLK
jgi:hypothetical protein